MNMRIPSCVGTVPSAYHPISFQIPVNVGKAKMLCLLVLISLISISTTGQGYLKVDGQQIVNGKGENIILRGVGLGGWMWQEGYMLKVRGSGQQQHKIRERIAELIGMEKTEEFYNSWLANHTRKVDIDSMRAWGFNSVRLPIHYNLYTLPIEKEPVAGQNTWIEKGFQMTDSLLAWCKANQLYLILDLHSAPGGQGNDLNIADRDPSKPSLWESEANLQKTIALWKKLAERYVNEPWIGAYDIINEPNWGFEDLANDKNGLKEKKNEPLKKLMVDITKAIREVDNKHIIIIEGNGWGNNYNGILPPWDANMVLSFHKYWNYNTQASIQHIIEAREKYNAPVWLGETGENSNVWFADAVRLLETNNIGWAWWPLKKLGQNNPMQIRSNPGYEKILSYWSDRGAKPSSEEAYKAVMELASATKLENTIIKRDVIDALIRQPRSATAIPYNKNIVNNGLVMAAADYDLGRNQIAYFDTDTANYHVSTGKREPSNKGNAYRNDGVDILEDSLNKGSYYIGYTEAGEWLQYTLTSAKTGNFKVKLTYTAKKETGNISLLLDGKKIQSAELPGATQWQTKELKNIRLVKGVNKLRVFFDKGGVELKTIELVRVR